MVEDIAEGQMRLSLQPGQAKVAANGSAPDIRTDDERPTGAAASGPRGRRDPLFIDGIDRNAAGLNARGIVRSTLRPRLGKSGKPTKQDAREKEPK